MPIRKLSAGTTIYLTKKNPQPFYMQPDKVMLNDNLYLAYDARADGLTVIPKGTRVVGDWITESLPSLAAQLQIKKIYLDKAGQDISGDSPVIEATDNFDNDEVRNASHIYKINDYKSMANIKRRIVNSNYNIRPLRDRQSDTVYLEICTNEIPVVLNKTFVPMPCF